MTWLLQSCMICEVTVAFDDSFVLYGMGSCSVVVLDSFSLV